MKIHFKAALLGSYVSLSSLLPTAFATTPTPPVTIEATNDALQGSLINGVQLPYVINLKQSDEVKTIGIQATLAPYDPKSFATQKQVVFKQALDRKDQSFEKLTIPLMFKDPGVYELTIHIDGIIDQDNGFSHDIQRYIFIDPQRQYWLITPKQFVFQQRQARQKKFEEALRKDPNSPDIRLLDEKTLPVPRDILPTIKPHEVKSPMQAQPVGPSKTILQYVKPVSDKAWSTEDPLFIRGRLVYQDFDGITRPLVNVSVNLYDEDTGFDEHLGTTVTDWNGNWSFNVNNNDGWWADGRDIYYTFKLENTRIRVQDCDGIDSTYSWHSATHEDLAEGSVVNFGTETGSTNREAMQVWNTLNLAWNGVVTQGQRDPGFVDSCYPEDGGTLWSRFWEEIDVNAADNDAPDSITHEYGHALMYYAYDSDNPSPGGSHSFGDDAQNPSLAWSEGWATGFMLALRPDGRYNWSEGDTGRSIENFSDAGNRDGNRNEGRVAAALNDMLDNPNDDNGGNLDRGRNEADDDNAPNRVSLATMINGALWGGWHTDFKSYWTSLSGELAGATLGDASEIMYYNYMDVPKPINCAATQITTLENPHADTILEGLRRFRDHGLKGFNGGQQLINSYYRNSPELAFILLKDAELRKNALHIIDYFSRLGFILTEHKQLTTYTKSRQPIIDDKMAQLIQSTIEGIQHNSSEELKNDMHELGEIIKSVQGFDISDLQNKLEDTKTKHPKTHRTPINLLEFTETSRKIAESGELDQILKNQPAFDR